MSLLDRITSQAAAARSVQVPEWGEAGKPLVIHFQTPTLAHRSAAMQVAPKDPIRQNIDILCQLATDESGQPLFKRLDGLTLMEKADERVLARIMRAMGIIGDIDDETLEKN